MAEAETFTEDERERYDAAWMRYCVYTTCSWLLSGTYLAWVTILTLFFPSLYKSGSAFETATVIWAMVTMISGWVRMSFRCPRCRQCYFRNWFLGVRYYRWFTSNCVHCGLRKYTYGDETE